jgi:hypothetical protein
VLCEGHNELNGKRENKGPFVIPGVGGRIILRWISKKHDAGCSLDSGDPCLALLKTGRFTDKRAKQPRGARLIPWPQVLFVS